MPDGFDFKDVAGEVLKQIKDKVAPTKPEEPRWSIWDQPNQPQRPGQPAQLGFPFAQAGQPAQPGQPVQPGFPPVSPRGDGPLAPAPIQAPPPEQPTAQMRPEQMLGTGRADDRTKNLVFQDVAQAQNQSYRSQSAKIFMKAIDRANQSQDPSLQALAKVEYGLANMSWGFSQEGFKWILEAGSNNPSIYDAKSNQSFLKRLSQVGMPQGAVDLLMQKGQQDPTWYIKDNDAVKKLDSAMTGPAFVAPTTPEGPQPQRPGADPLAPPTTRPDQVNPQLEPPPPGQAGTWIREQVNVALRNAGQEKNWQSAFGIYKQAVDMADRARDPQMQATTRVETGLALMSWGNLETGYKWILDAGSKNPSLYDSRVNKGYIDRLASAGIPKPAIDMLMANGQRDPHWGLTNPDAAKQMEAITRNPNPPKTVPQIPVSPFTPRVAPDIPQPQPAPQPQPGGHIKKNPFGG